jgi:hypothetical protein
MVYNNLNYWISGHRPSSRIIILEKATFQKLDLFLSSGEGRVIPTLHLNADYQNVVNLIVSLSIRSCPSKFMNVTKKHRV